MRSFDCRLAGMSRTGTVNNSCELSALMVLLVQWETARRQKHGRRGGMEHIQTFQTVAQQGGFIEVNQSQGATVLWLRKRTPSTVRETHQRMCIDSLTKSATVYWTGVPGQVKSRTFRDATALQEWCKVEPEITPQR
jgi:hypothetical protein